MGCHFLLLPRYWYFYFSTFLFNLFFSIFRLFCSTFFKVYPSGLLFLTLHVLMLIPTTEFFISIIFIPVFPLGSFYDFGFFLCIANIFLYLLMSSSGLFQVLYAYISIILPQVVYVVLLWCFFTSNWLFCKCLASLPVNSSDGYLMICVKSAIESVERSGWNTSRWIYGVKNGKTP